MDSYVRDAHRDWRRALHALSLLALLIELLVMPATVSAKSVAQGAADEGAYVSSALNQDQHTTTQPQVKLQAFLQTLAAEEPTDLVRVIVQHDGATAALTALLTPLEGTVVNELALIDALVVTLRAGALPTLAQSANVRWIALDAPVHKSATDGSSANVRDDFDTVTFAGSSGAFPWLTDWTEIGESDGAAAGHVAVASFWGGALSGLRLERAAMGATRTFARQGADQARLGLAFRRKDFNEQDYLLIEASVDGGASWLPVAHLQGPVTDAEIQYGDYLLPTFQGEQIAIRLMTAPTMSDAAKFYVDALDLRLQGNVTAPQRLYLPLVSSAGAPDEIASAATKPEAMVQASGVTNACFWRCFNLAALQSTYIKAIGADKLWNVPPYPRGWGVTVAVVDSGISPHPDLNDYNGNSRILKQVNFVTGNPVPDDFYGHGTHVAGTVAGLGTASLGSYMGVAPEARLVDVKVTDDYGMGNTSTVVAGLEWIYKNRTAYNIKVANLSLNSTVPESYHQSALNAALEVLWLNRIVVVVSAGNGGKEKLYPPANDPFVITVGAMDDKKTVDPSDDKLATFSAYGITVDGLAKPDIVAPGQDIVSLLASDDMNLVKNFPNNLVNGATKKYFRMSGTSMAAAVVAGAVAVLLEDEPTLSPDQVKYRLMATARPVALSGATCATGAGYLDLYAAVNGTTFQSANVGQITSRLLGSSAISAIWNSVSWNSVSWNSVSWNSVSWNSVSWNSVSWNSNAGSNSGSNSDSCTGAIADVELVNAVTGRDVQSLYDGVVIDLDAIGTPYLSARAETTGAVQSIKFDVNNGVYNKVENAPPYTLYGDNNGAYAASMAYPGRFVLKAFAYGADNASGALLDTREYYGLIISAAYKPTIRNAQSGLCLQPTSGSGGSGVQVEQRSCSWPAYQKFQIKLVSGRPDTVTLINSNNGLCLDINGAAHSANAAAIQWSCHGGENQQFRLKAADGGAFNLVAVHSGKCLELVNNSTANGAKLVQNNCAEVSGQQWWFE